MEPGPEPQIEAPIEAQIGEWRAYLLRRRTIHQVDVDELEDHLRSQMSELGDAGLDDEEAFLVALKRMGGTSELAREFARERSRQLWKQLVLADDERGGTIPAGLLVTIGIALATAAAFKLPALFGIDPFAPAAGESGDTSDEAFYLRNAALIVLPFLVGFFAWRRGVSYRVLAALGVPFVVAALAVNLFPLGGDSDTQVLMALHLPIALWFVVGVAYLGGVWRADGPRMDFVRFTGEWFIYYTLIALGGGVLTALTFGVFEAIDIDVERVVGGWVLPCGAVGAVIVVAWLVEAKQSVIENMAPVLTSVFTPLFALMLVAALVGMVFTGNVIGAEREVLIVLDFLLILVLGLILYALSAREPDSRPTVMDWVQLVLVVAALLIDVLALAAIAGRISEFGFTPNRTAGLGLNVVLLVNLAWSAWLLAAFLRGRRPFADLERWQTRYIPVYALWATTVVLAFPPLFDFA